MDGLICFPWEPCVPLPRWRLGRIPESPKAGGCGRSGLVGEAGEQCKGLGPASLNTTSFWLLSSFSAPAKPEPSPFRCEALCSQERLSWLQKPEEMSLPQSLNKWGNSVSGLQSKTYRNPSSSIFSPESSPRGLCCPSFPPDSPQPLPLSAESQALSLGSSASSQLLFILSSHFCSGGFEGPGARSPPWRRKGGRRLWTLPEYFTPVHSHLRDSPTDCHPHRHRHHFIITTETITVFVNVVTTSIMPPYSLSPVTIFTVITTIIFIIAATVYSFAMWQALCWVFYMCMHFVI